LISRPFASALVGMALLLGACAHQHRGDNEDESGVNAYPTDYKREILAAMHAYLNDPSGIRDAAISEPELKPTAGSGSIFNASPTHFMVCLRFNPKKSATEYAGVKEVAAVFIAGRFEQFIEPLKDQCAGATYAPFPELQTLSR
jgi:hypothetical protein